MNAVVSVIGTVSYTHLDVYKRQGFNHLLHLQGECDHAQMTYIIRNHDDAKFEAQKQLFIDNCAFLNKRYGDGTFTLKLVDQ